MIGWLNLDERPAVQVEALLAITGITELCVQQTYLQQAQQSNGSTTSALAAATQVVAAQAAAAGAKGGAVSEKQQSSWNEAMETANRLAASSMQKLQQQHHMFTQTPGSVAFPPTSFSQRLSNEAMQAFHQNLSATLQSTAVATAKQSSQGKANNSAPPPVPLFPTKGGINFSSLTAPTGSTAPLVPNATSNSHYFLPPPSSGNSLAMNSAKFPQQLSLSSQNLLLRHNDAIPSMIRLLCNPDPKVYEQAMWLLGNLVAGGNDTIGGGSTGLTGNPSSALEKSMTASTARDRILKAGAMSEILKCLEAHPLNISLQSVGSWTLSNLLDGIFNQASSVSSVQQHGSSRKDSSGGPGSGNGALPADFVDTKELLPVLKRLLNMSEPDVLIYTCWTLSHLCDGPSSHIAEIVLSHKHENSNGSGLVPRLVDLLTHPNWRVTKPALRTIGNIVCAECGDDAPPSAGSSTTADYTDVILECKAVPRLKELITHNHKEIQKEACWTLSNIAAGTIEQIQSVIDSGAIAPLVLLVQDKNTDAEVKSEACWVVLNATSCGCDSQIETLVGEGCVSVLGVLLFEQSMVSMALEGLDRVLRVEETREALRREQIARGEIDEDDENRPPPLVRPELIQKVLNSKNNVNVSKSAEKIWKEHFVSCALCKKSFSKHRVEDASFCDECKCHVCSNCSCSIYHLDYQEELWAETEQKTEQKKQSKKSKNRRKKEKMKLKKLQEQQEIEEKVEPIDESTAKEDVNEDEGDQGNAEYDENQIDLVLYLQQTGSVIALAKLMDSLYKDEELDDYERRMIREQRLMKSQNV